MKMSAQRINTTKHLAIPKHAWSSDESPLRCDSPVVDQDPLTHPQGSLIIASADARGEVTGPAGAALPARGRGWRETSGLCSGTSHTANPHSILPGKDSLNKPKACLCETASLFWESSQEGK